MSDYLAAAERFSFHAEVTEEELLESGMKIQLSTEVDMVVRRPNRLWADVDDGHAHKRFWYDGRTLTLLSVDANLYATSAVPPTIDQTIDHVMEELDVTLPLADFAYSSPNDILTAHVKSGVYAGVHLVRGVPSHHLVFSQENVDWQIWIEEGNRPLPRKLVITYKNDPAIPQFEAHLSDWDFAPHTPDEMFVFDPPDGARKIAFRESSD
jgi:hypothetical protein